MFATIEYDEQDVYPGVDELEQFAEVACLRAVRDVRRGQRLRLDLSYSWLVPSLAGWNDEDDRDVLCVLADADGAPADGHDARQRRDSGTSIASRRRSALVFSGRGRSGPASRLRVTRPKGGEGAGTHR